jgi:hypothetical protein
MFNIHDSPVPPRESTARTKSEPKSNPSESSATRGKRKRPSSRRDGEEDEQAAGELESSASSLDVVRQPPPLRESSVSAETTTSLTAMSSVTIPAESITSIVAPDALGRQLTSIRRIFFTPTVSCTQQTFLTAHESVVSLLSDMRLVMNSAAPSFSAQREEAIRFVTVIGIVCRLLALKLEWPFLAEEDLSAPIHHWDHWIRRSWSGWVIQFIRLVTLWFHDVIAPNNIIRELLSKRGEAPDIPLVALGGDNVLFEELSEMSLVFQLFVEAPEKSEEDKRFWGMEVLRALVLLLGDGINFAFIEGAFSPAVDLEGEEEEAQTLLDAFEATRPPGLNDDGDEEEEGQGGSEEDEDEEGEDTFILRYGPQTDDADDDEETVPFFFFPTRRSGLNHPEQEAAKDVPVVSHRKAYSGHCNVQTVNRPCTISV